MAWERGAWIAGGPALAWVGCGGEATSTPDAEPAPDLELLAAYEEQDTGDEAMFAPPALDYAFRGERTRPTTLGTSRTAELAIVAGRVEDCGGGFVENAIIRLYDPDGAPVAVTSSGPFFHSFNGDAVNNQPAQNETDTSADGLCVIIEMPVVRDGLYRVEAWGELDGELRIVAASPRASSGTPAPSSTSVLSAPTRRRDARRPSDERKNG